MRVKNLIYLVAVLLLLSGSDLKAQWSGRHSYHWGYNSYIMGDAVRVMRKKPFQRFSVGISYVPVSATFSYRMVDVDGVADSTHSLDAKGGGFGVAYAMGIPVARVGNKSLAAISVGLLANWYLLNGDPLTLKVDEENYHSSQELATGGGGFMIGVPVGLDLVSGGEATLDRADPLSFTLGVGVMPMISMGIMYEFAAVKVRAPGYIKAELGFHAGINWKLRGTYIFKSPTSFSQDRNDIFSNYGNIESELKSNDQFMFSLLVQPFSFGWE